MIGRVFNKIMSYGSTELEPSRSIWIRRKLLFCHRWTRGWCEFCFLYFWL